MKDDSFRDFVMEQLAGLGPVECRPMFGGYGLTKNRTFFGIIHKSRLYFKVSDTTRSSYIDAGMQSFVPSKKQNLKSFYEVPADVAESPPLLIQWAMLAIASANIKISLRSPKKRRALRKKIPKS
jgi:DNA transformation protein